MLNRLRRARYLKERQDLEKMPGKGHSLSDGSRHQVMMQGQQWTRKLKWGKAQN